MTGWRGQRYLGQSSDVFGREFPYTERVSMSNALWCDKGEHAFSAKDQFKQHFVNTHSEPVLTGNSYGNPTYQNREIVTEEMDICGPCWSKDNPFTTPEPSAIEMAEAEAEQSAAEMWEAKFNAEHTEVNRLKRARRQN